eukprot:TRINITY_DN4075_c0_g1_i2.p1 TRINITY_DN4075_c0_g1~~TRINITY_DN4075_c0_g1_i2.p1  ORF type:complete len:519 (-),score=130.35 TRINITY_DN4075_c0_g1_i2:161-1717(-)
MLGLLKKQINFTGLWIDMNEPASFCPGECHYEEVVGFSGDLSDPAAIDRFVNYFSRIVAERPVRNEFSTLIPYIPGGFHYGNVPHFNVHSLFGFGMGHASYDYLKNKMGQPLPFIISRSTAFGSGQFVSHWTGDNIATWDFLRFSISGIMNFNLFGIPFTGSDICGFGMNTTVQLCARWAAVGSFYPFSRNHNQIGYLDQEPYALGPDVQSAFHSNLKLRYSILKFYYTLFVRKAGLGTVFRPLFYEWPDDPALLQHPIVDEEILLGEELLISPVLYENRMTVSTYFPKGEYWYDFVSGRLMRKPRDLIRHLDIRAPLGGIVPIFLRGGYIVATQDTKNVTRTHHLNNDFSLVVALRPLDQEEEEFVAKGTLAATDDYNDWKRLSKCFKANCILNFNVVAKFVNDSFGIFLTASNQDSKSQTDPITLKGLRLLGVPDFQLTEKVVIKVGQNSKTFKTSNAVRLTKYTLEVEFPSPIELTDGVKVEVSFVGASGSDDVTQDPSRRKIRIGRDSWVSVKR